MKNLARFIQHHTRLLSILCLFIIAFNILSPIITHSDRYLSFNFWQRFAELRQEYLDSQYVNKHPKAWIADETVNSYAGATYIKGLSPVLIAPDTPPLGRYLIGLSATLFNNENIIILFFAAEVLTFLFLLGRQIFRSQLTVLIAIVCITSEPIFKNQLIYVPLLDIMQLGFLTSCFYFYNLGLQKKSWMHFVIANILLGCFIATKFYATGVTIIGAFLFVSLIHRLWGKVMKVILTFPLAILVLLATYLRVFSFKSYTLLSFLGIQKYIFLYHKSQLILPFTIWPLLLFNKWYVWWGSTPVLSDPQWLITWPIITVCSFIFTLLYVLKKIQHNLFVEVIMTWVVSYLLFFSVGQITARYFIILIPMMYLVTLYGIESFIVPSPRKKR